MEDPCYALSIAILRYGDTYQIELSHTDPTSHAVVAPQLFADKAIERERR